jgi:hypothetical protein
MKRIKRWTSLLLVLVMLLTMFPTMRLTPAVHAEWGDGESCFVCDGYLDYQNCCQGCGGVHAEDVNSECYNAMHCQDCGECLKKCPQQLPIPTHMKRLVELTKKK